MIRSASAAFKDFRRRSLHFILAEAVGIGLLEPLPQPLGAVSLGGVVAAAALLQHGLLDEQRRVRPERERDGVGRPAVDGQLPVRQLDVDLRIERVFLEVIYDDTYDVSLDLPDEVPRRSCVIGRGVVTPSI